MFSQVRRLVVVEWTALFDIAGIDLKPHKALKIKTKGAGGRGGGTMHVQLGYPGFTKCVCLCMQRVVCLEFLSSLYWIRTRGGLPEPKCHSYCRR